MSSHPLTVSVPRRHRALGALLVAGLALGSVAAAGPSAGAATAPDGSTSVTAFYATPSPIPTAPPGTIVRREPLPAPFAGAKAWRVMYTSRGVRDEPVVVTGMVFAPAEAAPAGSRPVVSWAHPTTGIVDACAPSRSSKPYADVQGLQEFVDHGWVVAATDYQGLGTDGPHPYLVGTSEAHGVLDAVRAAIAMPETAAGTETFVWGHSQGGQAVLFATHLAPTYAPELRLVAAAAAAPAGELVALFDADRDTFAGSVLGAYAVVSWSEVFGYDPTTVIRSSLLGRTKAIAGRCVVGASRGSDAALFVDDLILKKRMWVADPATTPPWKAQFVTNTPGPPVTVPVLITQGSADKIVRPPTTEQLVARYRAAGDDVREKVLPGVDHMKAGKVSAPIVAAWFERLAG